MESAQNKETGHAKAGHWPMHEIVNTLTHFAGFLLAIGAVPVLITMAALYGTAREISTFSIYSAALILTYLASTLYHAAPPGALKRFLHRLDHMSIYLLIAGTYTPFLLISLGGAWGWSLFGVLWGLAAVGIVIKVFFVGRFDLISTLAYVLMGWAGLVAIVPLYENLPPVSFKLVLIGGACYTLGALFYLWRSFPHHHGIWHVFCVAGSVLQFIAVFYLLA
ncbi:MAG: hemolysin III family protein [Gammaproteobacteria bacterium]|nr:hemolysin III family protein [Gammaproteobacteria bacterium]